MSLWRTVFTGMLGLAVLEAAVSSTAAAGRVGGLFTAAAGVISRVLDPTVAAIPDLRKHGGAATSSAPATGTGGRTAVPTTLTTSATPGSLLPQDWTTSAAAHYL